MPFRIRIFRPDQVFRNKRVALVGPADSAYEEQNGAFIDDFDYVIRMNKVLVTWDKNSEQYLGQRTDVLFHSFYENMDSGGGGPLDWELFNKFGVRYLVQPRFDKVGLRLMFNYFKKYLNTHEIIYVFPRNYYQGIISKFKKYHPTRGFYALYSVLTTACSEVFITGFTFFKTPYAKGYRDNIQDSNSSREHILDQGLHDIDLEYSFFQNLLINTEIKSVFVDDKLFDILKHDSVELANKVKKMRSSREDRVENRKLG